MRFNAYPAARLPHSPTVEQYLDEAAINRLRWRCRRGLLENDLFIERFFARHAGHLSPEAADALMHLMNLSDNDLLDLLLRRTEPGLELSYHAALQVLEWMRQPAPTPFGDVAGVC